MSGDSSSRLKEPFPVAQVPPQDIPKKTRPQHRTSKSPRVKTQPPTPSTIAASNHISTIAESVFRGERVRASHRAIRQYPFLAGMVPRIPGSSSAVLPSSSSLSRASASSSFPLHTQWTRGPKKTLVRRYHRAVWPSYGITTPAPDRCPQFPILRSPFYFQTGYALCAKRTPRPFPPPFLSPPSSSFSDPLTTHYHSQDKRLSVRGELVRGLNNGDDAVLVTENLLGVNDGVGAWATKPRGHAAYVLRFVLILLYLVVIDTNGLG